MIQLKHHPILILPYYHRHNQTTFQNCLSKSCLAQWIPPEIQKRTRSIIRSRAEGISNAASFESNTHLSAESVLQSAAEKGPSL